MRTRFFVRFLVSAAVLLTAAQVYASGVYITEWMYSGGDDEFADEFIEFTNLSGSPVDFNGWSYDDDSRTAGVFDLSGFGTVAAGDSVIITEAIGDDFRTAWGLESSVKVIGGYTNNLGRNDEINLYNDEDVLIDRLTYNDEDPSLLGGPRTKGRSGRPGSSSALGANDPDLWVLSSVGDSEGSWTSTFGDIGSPGTTAVPLPGAAWLLGSGLAGLIGFARRHIV